MNPTITTITQIISKLSINSNNILKLDPLGLASANTPPNTTN